MTQAYIYAQYLMEDVRNYLLTPKKGQGMVEYALIIALIGVLLVATLGLFRTQIIGVFTRANTALGTTTP